MIRQTETYDFDPITKGDTFLPISFEFFNEDEQGVLSPVAIASFLCQLKPYGTQKVALDLTGSIEGNRITLDQVDRLDLKAQTYVYDMEITETDGTIFTYLKGTLKVLQDVSNS